MQSARTLLATAILAAAAMAQRPPDRPPITLNLKLPGWADLHAHPASHMAFGADSKGNGGIFWGDPGLELGDAQATILSDLPKCNFKHSGYDDDLIRHETRKALMEQLDEVTEYPHQTADFGDNNLGSPDFKHWPHARSISHEQMHITMIRRAYDGGQRLMIASVTDNEFLSDMWTKIGYNALGNPVPSIDPNFGYNSAKRQLDFIKKQAAANSTWMQVVHTPDEATTAIRNHKMAIILSLEMDSLTPAQVLKLVKEEGVRHVIPIHLINNQMGGTAVYSDAFNAVNNFVNGGRNGGEMKNNGFFKVLYDKKISDRLGRPSYPRPEGNNLFTGGAIWIDPVPDNIWDGLDYDFAEDKGGHRNSLGLTAAGENLFKSLAQQGVLIDLVHMSQEATEDALNKAIQYWYPVMNSHSGLRNADETSHTERDLMRKHAKTISALKGIIGLGTGGGSAIQVLRKNMVGNPLVRFTGELHERTWDLPDLDGDPYIANLVVRLKTGGDDLRGGGDNVFAVLYYDGSYHYHQLNEDSEGWRAGLVKTVNIALPRNVRLSELKGFTLSTTFKGGIGGDNWNLDELEIRAVTQDRDAIATWLSEYKEALEIMNGRGLAIGTDINGFAPQIPFSADAVNYPITIAQRFSTSAPALPKHHMGNKTFDFQKDGLAHYGMLPDFFQAVSQQPDSQEALAALFSTADDVVEMWKDCLEAATKIK
jgi:microsomal dipeptidase-like Zn-dependent dipeptidase